MNEDPNATRPGADASNADSGAAVEAAAEADCLLQRYFEREIDERQCARLIELWTLHPELRETAAKNYEVNHLLHFQARMDQARRKPTVYVPLPPIGADTEADVAIDSDADVDLLFTETVDAIEKTTIKRKIDLRPFSKSSVALVLIVCCLGILAVYHEFSGGNASDAVVVPRNDTFVRITEIDGAEWAEGAAFKTGSRIGKEKIELLKGLVKLEFDNGAELVLEGPAEFVVNGPLQTFCQSGKTNVHIPQTAVGFELSTPFSKVVDLGTEFSVLVDRHSSDVHVLDGRIDLSRNRAERLSLVKGEAMRSVSSGTLEKIACDEAACIRRSLFDSFRRKQVDEQAERRDRLSDRLAADPDVLAWFDGARFHGPGSGTILGCRRAGDRERKAMRIQGHADYFELNVPGKFNALTLILAVRVHRLEHLSRLLISDNYYAKSGVMVWQLDRSGELQFHVRTKGQNTYDAFDMQKAFQLKDLETWTVLAVSVDGPRRTVTHFKDGREIARFPWAKPIPIEIGRSYIGNEGGATAKKAPRHLDADIGALAILRRALSAQEIADIYEMMK